MECPNCHTRNDEDAFFCKKCGTRLVDAQNEMSLLPSVVETEQKQKEGSNTEPIKAQAFTETGMQHKAESLEIEKQHQDQDRENYEPGLAEREESDSSDSYIKPGMEYMDPNYVEPKVFNLKGGSWWWILAWPLTVLVIFLISFLFVWIQVMTGN